MTHREQILLRELAFIFPSIVLSFQLWAVIPTDVTGPGKEEQKEKKNYFLQPEKAENHLGSHSRLRSIEQVKIPTTHSKSESRERSR